MKKGIKIIFYCGFFLATFLLFVYWMFPADALKGRVMAVLEEALGSEYQVEIGSFGLSRLTGAVMKEVSVSRIEEGKKMPVWKADKIRGRAGIFSLIFGSPKIRFDIQSEAGRFRGVAHQAEEGWFVEADLKGIDLSKFPLVRKTTGLQLNSQIEGALSFQYNPKQPLNTTGEFQLVIEKLILKKSELTLGEMGTFPLPDLSLASSESAIKAKLEKGSINFDQLELKGDDFLLELKGRIFLAAQMINYRMNLQGKFRFSPKIWQVLDPVLPEKFVTELKKQKGAEETLPINFDGPFSSPQIYSGPVKIYPFQPF